MNFDIAYLNKFFLKNHNQILKKLERVLKRLYGRGYINFKQCLIIYDNERLEYRIDTDEEFDIILAIEKIVLKEMYLRHKGHVYISGKWKNIYNRIFIENCKFKKYILK